MSNPYLVKLVLIEAIQAHKFDEARRLLHAYRSLKPDDPDVQVLTASIKSLEEAEKRQVVGLDDSSAGECVSDETLHILFVQDAPCIRNYKAAVSLGKKGHKVTLAYTRALLSQMYPGLSDSVYEDCIRIQDFKHLWDIAERFDIVHCHNEPDVLTVAALAGGTPVVHDTHDLLSLRHPTDSKVRYFEGIANRGADGRVYVSGGILEIADREYGIDRSRSIVVNNRALSDDIPRRYLPKQSALDGQIHIVYQGGIGVSGHRDFRQLFARIAETGVAHIHIYPSFHNPEIKTWASQFDRIHYNNPVSPTKLLEVISQYDYGIVPFNVTEANREFLDTALPNKLFEYLAAGLPVIVPDLVELRRFVRQENVGIVYQNVDNIIHQLPILRHVQITGVKYTFEDQVDNLVQLYRTILESENRSRRSGSATTHAKKDIVVREELSSSFYDQVYEDGGWNGEYNKSYDESAYASAWRHVVAWLKLLDNPRILDVGCGVGQFAEMLHESDLTDYVGFDFSEKAIERARLRLPAMQDQFHVADAYSTELFDVVGYDCAVFLEVLEHLEKDRELLLRVRPGAHVILSVPNYDSRGHVRFFNSPEEVVQRYRDLITVEDTSTIQFPGYGSKLFLLHGRRTEVISANHRSHSGELAADFQDRVSASYTGSGA